MSVTTNQCGFQEPTTILYLFRSPGHTKMKNILSLVACGLLMQSSIVHAVSKVNPYNYHSLNVEVGIFAAFVHLFIYWPCWHRRHDE